MNQTQAILSHLKIGKHITSMQAFELYGITRLSAKICELRKRGYNIQTIKHKTTTRFGNSSHYFEYYLAEEKKEN